MQFSKRELIDQIYSIMDTTADENELLQASKILLKLESEHENAIKKLEHIVDTKQGKVRLFAIAILLDIQKKQDSNKDRDIDGIIL